MAFGFIDGFKKKPAQPEEGYSDSYEDDYYGEFNGYDDSGNSGLWVRMENQLRKWADKLSVTDTIFVCKGGTIDSEANIITCINGKLIVPKYF